MIKNVVRIDCSRKVFGIDLKRSENLGDFSRQFFNEKFPFETDSSSNQHAKLIYPNPYPKWTFVNILFCLFALMVEIWEKLLLSD